MSENITIYRRRITFLILASVAPFLAVSPFAIGYLGSLTVPGGCNESNCGWAVLPWFMFITVPAGFFLYVGTLIAAVFALAKRVAKTEETTAAEKKLKRYQLAWTLTAFSPLLLLIGALVASTGNTALICDDAGCTQNLPGFERLAVLYLGGITIALSWPYLIAVAVWNKVKGLKR